MFVTLTVNFSIATGEKGEFLALTLFFLLSLAISTEITDSETVTVSGKGCSHQYATMCWSFRSDDLHVMSTVNLGYQSRCKKPS